MPHLTIGDPSVSGGSHLINYETRGSPSASEKIIFIMGLLTDGQAWNYQADFFSQHGYECVIYDNRGRSDAHHGCTGQSTYCSNSC